MPRFQMAQGPKGDTGATGPAGPSGATPTATLTSPYTVASGATVLALSDTSSLLVGAYAQVTDGSQVISGKVTGKTSSTSLTFTPLATRPTGEPANGYVFVATTSLMTMSGAQGPTGATGATGSNGTNGTNGTTLSTTTTASYTITATSSTIAVASSVGFQIGSQVYVGDGTNQVYGRITALPTGTSITFLPDTTPSTSTLGNVIAASAQVIPAGAQGATGSTGGTGGAGSNGTNGATPYATTTSSYTWTATATSINVTTANGTGAFAAGQAVVLVNAAGTNKTHGILTAVSGTALTFQALATTPPGDNGTGTTYAIGSTIVAAGSQGATGATGSSGGGFSSSFRAYQTTSQGAITGATWTKVLFPVKVYDTSTEFSIATSRFTATAAGVYNFSASVSVSVTSGQTVYLALYVNGVLDAYVYATVSGSINPVAQGSFNGVKLAASDYVEVYVYGTGSPSVNSGVTTTYFAGVRTQ